MQWHEKVAFVVRCIGTTYTLIGASLTAGLLLWLEGRERDTLLFLSSVLAAMVIVKALKIVTNKPRPKHGLIVEKSRAFPSGHATLAVTFATLVVYTSHDYLSETEYLLVASIAYICAFLVAASRIILRVHTLFEVVAGVILGATIPLLIISYQDVLFAALF